MPFESDLGESDVDEDKLNEYLENRLADLHESPVESAQVGEYDAEDVDELVACLADLVELVDPSSESAQWARLLLNQWQNSYKLM